MLTEKDREFIIRWEMVREREGGFKAKLLNGLPMAALFSLPILLLVLVVYLFLPQWYTRVSNRIEGSLITIIIALFSLPISGCIINGK